MRIEKIHCYRISIPFRKAFKHAQSERAQTDNLIVETRLSDGSTGYGEGLPREYVTGENQQSALSSLKNLNPSIFHCDLNNSADLISFLDSEILSQKNFPQDRENNTARCALELSILDAYLRSFKKTFFDLGLGLASSPGIESISEVRYDGVLSGEGAFSSLISGFKLKLFGFRRIKIKVGEDQEHDLSKIHRLRKIFGEKVDLRVDANGAWDLALGKEMARKLQKFHISSIEQPLPREAIASMAELKEVSPIPLMLDESLCSLKEARQAVESRSCDLFNIRLSKCGGFINSMRIAHYARQQGIGYQLGCMVGETGILSAAGRHFACMDPHLKYLEGSYDHFLLKDSLTREDLTIRRGGRAPALGGFGLGVQVDPEKLKQYTTFSTSIC